MLFHNCQMGEKFQAPLSLVDTHRVSSLLLVGGVEVLVLNFATLIHHWLGE